MHPISFYLRGLLSADFPGEASRYIESVYGDDVVVVWTQGAQGDQNPLYSRPGGVLSAARRAGGPADAIERAEGVLDRWIKAMGAVLGEEIIRVTNATTLRSDQARIWGAHRTVTCAGRTRLDDAREGVPGQYEDGPPVNIRVGMLTIGTTAIGSVNAEIYTGIGQRIKAQVPACEHDRDRARQWQRGLRLYPDGGSLQPVHVPGARIQVEARLRRGRHRQCRRGTSDRRDEIGRV